jgi:hypothetical protein
MLMSSTFLDFFDGREQSVENTVDGFEVLEIEVERGGTESLTGLG